MAVIPQARFARRSGRSGAPRAAGDTSSANVGQPPKNILPRPFRRDHGRRPPEAGGRRPAEQPACRELRVAWGYPSWRVAYQLFKEKHSKCGLYMNGGLTAAGRPGRTAIHTYICIVPRASFVHRASSHRRFGSHRGACMDAQVWVVGGGGRGRCSWVGTARGPRHGTARSAISDNATCILHLAHPFTAMLCKIGTTKLNTVVLHGCWRSRARRSCAPSPARQRIASHADTRAPGRRGKSAKVGRFGFQGFAKQKKLERNASVRRHPEAHPWCQRAWP